MPRTAKAPALGGAFASLPHDVANVIVALLDPLSAVCLSRTDRAWNRLVVADLVRRGYLHRDAATQKRIDALSMVALMSFANQTFDGWPTKGASREDEQAQRQMCGVLFPLRQRLNRNRAKVTNTLYRLFKTPMRQARATDVVDEAALARIEESTEAGKEANVESRKRSRDEQEADAAAGAVVKGYRETLRRNLMARVNVATTCTGPHPESRAAHDGVRLTLALTDVDRGCVDYSIDPLYANCEACRRRRSEWQGQVGATKWMADLCAGVQRVSVESLVDETVRLYVPCGSSVHVAARDLIADADAVNALFEAWRAYHRQPVRRVLVRTGDTALRGVTAKRRAKRVIDLEVCDCYACRRVHKETSGWSDPE